MITMIRLPAFSGRFPTCIAANTAAPDDIPQKMPSAVANLRAMAMASSPLICTISSNNDVSALPGMKPAPMP